MSIGFDEFLEKVRSLQGKLEKFPLKMNLNLKLEFKVVICGDCGVGKSSLLERLLDKRIEGSSTIFEPKIHPLAMIDFIQLPGLTEIALPGQSADYPEKTANWFDFHVSQADLVLLCVAVDADLVNSNGLKRIKNLNADAKSVLVLSKLDLLEQKSLSEDYLNVLHQVARDFDSIVALKNEKKEPFSVIDEKEAVFFEREFDAHDNSMLRFGIKEVKRRILNILNEKLSVAESEFKFQLTKIKHKLEGRLKSIKFVNGSCSSFLKLIIDFIDHVNLELEGTHQVSNDNIFSTSQWSDFSPGMRINLILWNNFPDSIKSINTLEGIDYSRLEVLIKNSQGLSFSCFQLENAFKHLVRQQMKISEVIVCDCVKLIYKELKECLLLKVTSIATEIRKNDMNESFSDEEFYDINSFSDAEGYANDFEPAAFSEEEYTLRAQLELIPSVCEAINEKIGKLLNRNHSRCLRYLKEFAEMQAETIYTDSPHFQEVVKEFYQNRPTWISSSLINLPENVENVEEVDDDEEEEVEISLNPINESNNGFLKEFIALIFPPVPSNIKRVEYRPQKQRQQQVKSAKVKFEKLLTRDEEFLLKVVSIYVKLYHGQLCDFVPKCVNYHLIRGTVKSLPATLLSDSKWAQECGEKFNSMRGDLVKRLEACIEDLNKSIN